MKKILVIVSFTIVFHSGNIGISFSGEWMKVKNKLCIIWNPEDPVRIVSSRFDLLSDGLSNSKRKKRLNKERPIIYATWSGECKNDYAHGYGVLQWYKEGERKDKYAGEYRNGKRNGKGTFTWANGDRYEGEWKDDERNGKGTFTWANGDRYEGEWKGDKRNGKGIFTLSNGEHYEGEWENDKRIDNIKKCTYESLKTEISQNEGVLLLLFGGDCGKFCNHAKKVVDEISASNNNLKVIKLNFWGRDYVDGFYQMVGNGFNQIISEYKISGTPTILFFINDKPICKIADGSQSLKGRINKFLEYGTCE